LARSYLRSTGCDTWETEIAEMIDQHHRLRTITEDGKRLVEIFRMADLFDFSLGFVRFVVPRSEIADLNSRFPNRGFHAGLARTAARWICSHPLNPVPVLKW
jgi:hypothetical protein